MHGHMNISPSQASNVQISQTLTGHIREAGISTTDKWEHLSGNIQRKCQKMKYTINSHSSKLLARMIWQES